MDTSQILTRIRRAGAGAVAGATTQKTWAQKIPKRKSKQCKYKSHSMQKKTHKRQSVPVVVPIKIDTNPSLNYGGANSKSTKMELALELGLSCNRHAASEHNHKLERVEIEEARQELNHWAQLQSKYKENMTALGGLLA